LPPPPPKLCRRPPFPPFSPFLPSPACKSEKIKEAASFPFFSHREDSPPLLPLSQRADKRGVIQPPFPPPPTSSRARASSFFPFPPLPPPDAGYGKERIRMDAFLLFPSDKSDLPSPFLLHNTGYDFPPPLFFFLLP